MRRSTYRTQPLLRRTPDAMPYWLRATLMWTAVAIAVMVISRGITVATMENTGPPPANIGEMGAP